MSKTPLSIRIIYVVTQIIYMLTIVAFLGTIFFAFSISTGIFTDEINMSIKLPLTTKVEEKGIVQFYGSNMEISYENAVGMIDSKNAPKNVAIIFSVLFSISSFFVVIITRLFYRFVRNVKEGIVFETDNFVLLRKLGYILLGLYCFLLLGGKFWKYGFKTEDDAAGFSIQLDGSLLVVFVSALFVIMISQLFLHGLKLKEENKLTI